MKIRVQSMGLDQVKGDVVILPVWKGFKQQPELTEIDQLWNKQLIPWLQTVGFEGGKKETQFIPAFGNLSSKHVLVIGLGERKQLHIDDLRWIGGLMVKKARELKSTTLSLIAEPFLQVFRPQEVASSVMEGIFGGEYVFHSYHPEQKEKHKERALQELRWIAHGSANVKAIEKGIEEAKALYAGVHLTRDLVNTIAHEMTPMTMAECALRLAKKHRGMTVRVLDCAQMEKKGMGAALAVGRGSENEPKLVHLVYKPKKATKKRIAIVGKAVTYDTGGLSLKPTESMLNMKCDMSGAAAVLGLFEVLPSLDIAHEVHGVFIAVENAISQHAYRPGDVVTAMNGTTIEIQNTDAEGRVVLADAILYAKEQDPSQIIDLATLTGACIVALGEEIAAVMGNDQKLVEKLLRASQISGDDLWQLPLPEKYKDHVKSKIAMIKNLGAKGQAGTIAGALFLQHFVGTTPWAHLDIAGPAYSETERRPDQPFGGSGFGVRLLVRYLQVLS